MHDSLLVVVPVYGHWPSLEACIESLKAFLPATDEVLFVNDCGPEAEAIERDLLDAIRDLRNFRYERNDRNLGFIGTCNRAVFELDTSDRDIVLLNSDAAITEGALDELATVLHLTEQHGTVTPRTNNAVHASVPFRSMATEQPEDEAELRDRRDPAISFEIWNRVKDLLRRYSVVPTGVGFCLMIKRRLITEFGLFDPIFGSGYEEENDFCLRINKSGYSSVLANHAFVYHLGSQSFGAGKAAQRERNLALIEERYPFFVPMMERYAHSGVDPVDVFAEAIAGPEFASVEQPPVKVLIDLHDLTEAPDEATRLGTGFARFLADLRAQGRLDGYEVVIAAPSPASAAHDLPTSGFRIVPPQDLCEIFSIGYSPGQVSRHEDFAMLGRWAARVVVTNPSALDLRTLNLLATDPSRADTVADSAATADRIVSISGSGEEDTQAFLRTDASSGGERARWVTIPFGASETRAAQTTGAAGAESRYFAALWALLTDVAAESVDLARLRERWSLAAVHENIAELQQLAARLEQAELTLGRYWALRRRLLPGSFAISSFVGRFRGRRE